MEIIKTNKEPDKNVLWLNNGVLKVFTSNGWLEVTKDVKAEGVIYNSETNSFAEGDGRAVAMGDSAHAEGKNTLSVGDRSHTEGTNNTAKSRESHVEGWNNLTRKGVFDDAVAAHAEGMNNIAEGRASHVEGKHNIAIGENSHVEGKDLVSVNAHSHAEGLGYIEDVDIMVVSVDSGAYSIITKTDELENKLYQIGDYYHVFYDKVDNGDGTFTYKLKGAWRNEPITTETIIHAHKVTGAYGANAHAEGFGSSAIGNSSHAEGGYYFARADYELGSIAFETSSHAEGIATIAGGLASHTEGWRSAASGNYSHAEGEQTTAEGLGSHAEGNITIASGNSSHAEGWRTHALGFTSHAEGFCTEALNECEHSEGEYNLPIENFSQHTIGIGSGNSGAVDERKNAILVGNDGRVFITGIGEYLGTEKTESELTNKDLASLLNYVFLSKNKEEILNINWISDLTIFPNDTITNNVNFQRTDFIDISNYKQLIVTLALWKSLAPTMDSTLIFYNKNFLAVKIYTGHDFIGPEGKIVLLNEEVFNIENNYKYVRFTDTYKFTTVTPVIKGIFKEKEFLINSNKVYDIESNISLSKLNSLIINRLNKLDENEYDLTYPYSYLGERINLDRKNKGFNYLYKYRIFVNTDAPLFHDNDWLLGYCTYNNIVFQFNAQAKQQDYQCGVFDINGLRLAKMKLEVPIGYNKPHCNCVCFGKTLAPNSNFPYLFVSLWNNQKCCFVYSIPNDFSEAKIKFVIDPTNITKGTKFGAGETDYIYDYDLNYLYALSYKLATPYIELDGKVNSLIITKLKMPELIEETGVKIINLTDNDIIANNEYSNIMIRLDATYFDNKIYVTFGGSAEPYLKDKSLLAIDLQSLNIVTYIDLSDIHIYNQNTGKECVEPEGIDVINNELIIHYMESPDFLAFKFLYPQ